MSKIDIEQIVGNTLAELGIRDEPAPIMDRDQADRYRDLLVAVNGRAMVQDGIEYVPRDYAYPSGEDYELRPYQEEIPAGDMLLLFELAGRYGLDISQF